MSTGTSGSRRAVPRWPAAALAVALAAMAPAPGRPVGAALTGGNALPANLFSLAAILAPTNLTAAASGNDVALAWTAGTNGDGYAVAAVSNGSSSDCSSASFGALGSAASTGYSDSGRNSPAGTYWCYRVTTTYGSSWTSVENNPVVAARIGFVAQSVTMTNAADTSGCSGSGAGASGTAGTLDCGDRLVLGFNQPVDPASGPQAGDTVCTDVLGVVRVASTTASGLCTAAETLHAGTLTGGTLGQDARFAAAYAWSDSNRTLTVTVGDKVSGLLFPTVSLASWTFTPAALASSTGAVAVCTSNAGGALCLPATAGGSSF